MMVHDFSVGCFATSSSKVISRPLIREWYTVPRFFYVKIVLWGAGRTKKLRPIRKRDGKMKKLLLIIIAAMFMLTACKKDNSSSSSSNGSTNELIGWWVDQLSGEPPHHGYVLKFINNNTVMIYWGDICDVNWGGMVGIPEHPGWYYYNGNQSTATYVFQDNKVIITNGDILTYMNNKLHLDNSSRVLSRW